MNRIIGKKIHIDGIVQGVGFRPFVYSTARALNISGWVRNSSSGVDIIANGHEERMQAFIKTLQDNPPPLSVIDSIHIAEIDPDGFDSFEIIPSDSDTEKFVPISPDVSICDDCRRELFDPSNRRFRYPFINCTNCGPRFTIIKGIPYDRAFTTMKPFEMCDSCRLEYENPIDRRFHAQPTACPECGPRIWLVDDEGNHFQEENGLKTARVMINEGKILAVKGLGGFHLACDAHNQQTIEELRKRKKRTDKPFAVMVYDIETAKKHVFINEDEEQMLVSRQKPIVVLDRKPESSISSSVAPGNNTIGVMLPYTPLHLLLLEPEKGYPECLVMTSGNISEEPISYKNEHALEVLSGIADGYLLNNRDIHIRTDDSVVREIKSSPYFLRRSRGYAPDPIRINHDFKEILAVGPELKNTFCLTRGNYAFISHHIGDLQNLETLKAFEEGIRHFENLFKITPTALASDLHPEYLSTKYAQQRTAKENIPLFKIQHHHAHLASCLADNSWLSDEPVIGLCFDGTGYGIDNQIWGGELFIGGLLGFVRAAHLEYMPLPGGDAGTRNPRRIAAAYLWKNGLPWDEIIPSMKALADEERRILNKQLVEDINCPLTSSMGRLFDAVSSLIGVRHTANYEAQAAIELEAVADHECEEAYPFILENDVILIKPMLVELMDDLRLGISPSMMSAKFHNGIAQMAVNVCQKIRKQSHITTAALSGGVWQNKYLLNKTINKLEKEGFDVLIHRQVPCNDGGLSLGQAVILDRILSE